VLLAKEEMVLQSMIERSVEVENNCGKKNK
jgi:hypothetical protein